MTNLDKVKWHVVKDGVQLAREASDKILHDARLAIAERDKFNIVLAGGSTPIRTYQHMARLDAEWSRWQVYFGDERCLPRDDMDRNSFQIVNKFLNDVAVPKTQIHYILAESGFDIAVSDYERKIRHVMPFDLVLLGMGEDGHTASLFPGQEHDEKMEVVGVPDSPKPPSERVSLNYPSLCNTRNMLILIEGEHKRPAVQAWLDGEDLPISRVSGFESTDVYIDESAYPR